MRQTARIAASQKAPDPAWVAMRIPGWISVYLTWDVSGAVDAGIPAEVQSQLAAALGAVSRVVYLASADGKPSGISWSKSDDESWSLSLRAANEMVRRGSSRMVGLVCTRTPDVIAEMFDQTGFDWSLRGQLGLLFAPESDCTF